MRASSISLRSEKALAERRETDRVPVRVSDDEVTSSPGLVLQRLREGHAGGAVLGVKSIGVFNLDERRDEAIAVLGAEPQHRLVHKLEVHTGAIARHRSVERRLAVEEIDRKPERVA